MGYLDKSGLTARDLVSAKKTVPMFSIEATDNVAHAVQVMTENARLKSDRANSTKRVLIILAVILFFPIALPICLVIWSVKATSTSS